MSEVHQHKPEEEDDDDSSEGKLQEPLVGGGGGGRDGDDNPQAADMPPSENEQKKALQRRTSIRFAPLNIPLERRLQTLAVFTFITGAIGCVLISFLMIRSAGYVLYAFLTYITWMLVFQTFHYTGAIRCGWARHARIWRLFAGYFPIQLHKCCDLPADRPYIFAIHPHGMVSFGALCNFATDATGFDRLYPGIISHLVTLKANFRIPFYSLALGLHGICDASRKTFATILGRGKGNAIVVVVGGAKESLDSRPGTADLTLLNRKGFVKMALVHGASLVPVFSFGETSVYDQMDNPRGSPLREFQEMMQQKLGFAMPLVFGRGVFNYDFGLMPFRKPITSVVGAPVDVPKTKYEDITQALIDEYHSRYVTQLQSLYDEFKNVYDRKRSSSMRLVQ